ncbi:MAG: septum formation initiator family protein [Desulfobacteraceae bacterium]|nr:MAG: septum formation initiator family protein [Desulfobacteraceae bacterium]
MVMSEKLGVLFSVFVIIILFLLIVFGRDGLMDLKQLKQKEQEVLTQTHKIEEKNQVLAHEIHDLKTDPEYVEHVARHEHEMAAGDELVFRIREKQDAKGE